MKDFDAYRIYDGIDAEFVQGYIDGRDHNSPVPSTNRDPAYRHSWDVGRAEIEGRPLPASFCRARAKHIEQGGEYYPASSTGEAR